MVGSDPHPSRAPGEPPSGVLVDSRGAPNLSCNGLLRGDFGLNTTRNTLPSVVVVVVVVAAALFVAPAQSSTEADVRAAADGLMAWLAGGPASAPTRILPDRGTVQFGLRTLGSARSAVGSGQAKAVLAELRDSVRGYRTAIGSVDVEESSWAWVRISIEDRDGRPVTVLLLAFHAEDGRWVLRELRETPP